MLKPETNCTPAATWLAWLLKLPQGREGMKKGETDRSTEKPGSGFDVVTLTTTTTQNLSVIIVYRKWGEISWSQYEQVSTDKQFQAVRFLEEETAIASLCIHRFTWTRGKLCQF